MKEDRKLTFVESILISGVAGAASGALCGVGKVPEQNRKEFTGIMVNMALNGMQKLKEQDKEGYIDPGW